MMDKDEIITMIKDCMNRANKMNSWQKEFIESIDARVSSGRTLTEMQIHKLNEIWEKVT